MKVKELINILSKCSNLGYDEHDIYIITDSPSAGRTSSVGVSDVSIGSDWDRGRVLTSPITRLVKKLED